jgi:hypothetical protein
MLDTRLLTLLSKKVTVEKSKEVRRNLAEFSKERCGFKKAALPMMVVIISLSTMHIHCVGFFLSYLLSCILAQLPKSSL